MMTFMVKFAVKYSYHNRDGLGVVMKSMVCLRRVPFQYVHVFCDEFKYCLTFIILNVTRGWLILAANYRSSKLNDNEKIKLKAGAELIFISSKKCRS